MSESDQQEEPQVHFLLLAPYRDMSEAPHMAPNSMVQKANCGHWCWISPDGIFAQERKPLYTLCIRCGGEYTMGRQDAKLMMPPNSIRVIEETHGVAAADQARAFAQEHHVVDWDL